MCFTRIYGFIFCDPKVINSSAIKNITRSGTTFTATRLNNGTFTFTQQDNNTTYANYKGATTAASGTAGLVPAATTANRLYFLRGDGGWQVPTNTWRGIQNVLTSTSTSDSLSANMGKTLNDKINSIVVVSTSQAFNSKSFGANGYITVSKSYTSTKTILGCIQANTTGDSSILVSSTWYDNTAKTLNAVLNSTKDTAINSSITVTWLTLERSS